MSSLEDHTKATLIAKSVYTMLNACKSDLHCCIVWLQIYITNLSFKLTIPNKYNYFTNHIPCLFNCPNYGLGGKSGPQSNFCGPKALGPNCLFIACGST